MKKIKKIKGWAIVENETGRIIQVFTYKPSWKPTKWSDWCIMKVTIC